ncbi:type II toxin-antitoxin system RelE/ParE family toxin [Komarekiella sp. 'clone 1']|uniref:Type II toxin-antitoxin system RelE/ParE family toxin n=1 Tax=Komarekiella delphini-convector SJRDD-AB1 TaxID=2593771 RepID=A0AA40ST27_9NOST|nr:type II toxin-antitoxin system RelE/ParE family toxin [Komarekiella delphini-convector]MBD6614749.1 type II toxin-antitoxin system RelE/ParE family toxin [Komarekiella delphini-convector SJRDD-AB1]
MSRCIFAPSARLDLKEISSYINRFNPDAARKLKERIKQQCKLLADFPNMGQSCDNFASGLRSFPVEDYLIFYRLIDGGVAIVRVVSGYRDLETLFSSDDIL